MITSFFQRLESRGVAYLLISGQATVLYGASTFSEDLDLWIEPEAKNRVLFLHVLAALKARYYKLTPPFECEYLRRGHGFHFLLPEAPPVFLDVLGQPPRVPSFAVAKAASVVMDTDWGSIPTIGIRHLAELKKTQRLADYPVISRLALRFLETKGPAITDADCRWALDNVFTLPELRQLFLRFPATAACARADPVLGRFAAQTAAGGAADDDADAVVEDQLMLRIRESQRQDRQYWRTIIAELRDLRAGQQLMPEGAEVQPPA